ncbi:unnamed protein product, partial [Menidia menidia]
NKNNVCLPDVLRLKGQHDDQELHQHILLRLSFPPLYNSYNKFCCKLYPGGCYKLLDSAGYICDLLRGRVKKTEKDGCIEFEILNVQFVDAGYYRCGVLGAQTRIYSDYYFEVFEAPDHHRRFEPSPAPTIKTTNSSTLPTEPALSQDHTDGSRAPWSFSLPLAAVVSVTVMIFVSAVVGTVCFRVKAKSKQLETYGETLRESVRQEALVGTKRGHAVSVTHGQAMVEFQTSSTMPSGEKVYLFIIYTTVDFGAHLEPEDAYANLRMHKTPADVPDMDNAGTVVYSTLAVQQ